MLKLRSKEFKDDGTKTSKTRKTYNSSQYRRVAESFLGRVRVSKFKAGLLKYYILNLISDLFKVPSYEYVQIMTLTM